MLSNILFAPSFNSLFVTGFLILFILIILVPNYKQFMRLDHYRKIAILSLISIAFGVHGLIHLGVESVYGFNPYRF
jgi:hypothetical protein